LPETKGRSLEEMDAVFGSRAGVVDAELLREAQREVYLLAQRQGTISRGWMMGEKGEKEGGHVEEVQVSRFT
jgi:hypothetical protein